ncbi:MAG: TetR/AcrR family transcriptional regulator [Elusimicrobiota bacterium]
MARPRTYPPEIRREMILSAARRAMAKRGYQGLKLDEVARLAGIAKGTLYLYFKDKMDLLAGVFADLIARIDARVGRADSLRAAARESLAFIDEHRTFLTVFVGGHPDLKRTPSGRRAYEIYDRHLRRMGTLIKQNVKTAGCRRLDAAALGLYWDSLLRFFIERQEYQGASAKLVSREKEFVALLLHGLGAAK